MSVAVAAACCAGALAGLAAAEAAFATAAAARGLARRTAGAGGGPGRAVNAVRVLSARIARRLALTGPLRAVRPQELQVRLDAAGAPPGVGAPELLALKAAAAVVGLALGLLVAPAAPGRTAVLAAAAGPAAGFLAPDLFLLRRARARVALARRDLPGMLDLLRVTIEAGLPPARALGAVGSEFGGPLAAEWRGAAALTELGEPLDRVLDGVERRLPCPEVRAVGRALRSSRRLGSPLAEALGAQATAARHARATRVREAAARAGPKIQLVVALVLVPSVLLVVAAALLTGITTTGLGLPE